MAKSEKLIIWHWPLNSFQGCIHICSWLCLFLLVLLCTVRDESADSCCEAKVRVTERRCVYVRRRFHHSPLLALRWSMLLRGAASALLRTSTEISSLLPVSTVCFFRQSLRYPPRNRPFSTSVCLCKKKQRSLWLQVAEGQTMDGHIEEILAPLRLAVKEQVTPTYLLVPTDSD